MIFYSKDISQLNENDYKDGWALTTVLANNGLKRGMIQFHSKTPDFRFAIANEEKAMYSSNNLDLIVPTWFIEDNLSLIKSGVKPTLYALLDVNLSYFRQIPINLTLDKEFYNKFVNKAIGIAKKQSEISSMSIKKFTRLTQEVSNRKISAEAKSPKQRMEKTPRKEIWQN